MTQDKSTAPCPTCGKCPWPCEACDKALRDMVIDFLRGYTGPPEVAADELIRMVRQWDTSVGDLSPSSAT